MLRKDSRVQISFWDGISPNSSLSQRISNSSRLEAVSLLFIHRVRQLHPPVPFQLSSHGTL